MPSSALWCLRLTVALQCFAAGRIAWVAGSTVNGWLFMRAGFPESVGGTIDQVAAALLLFISAAIIIYPKRSFCFLAAGWMFALALTTYLNPGTSVDSLALFAHAVRFMAPLCLAFVLPSTKSELFEDLKVSQTTAWLLLLGASSTFIAHGIEAFEHYGRFIDLLIGSASRVGLKLSQSNAETTLTVIGVQDFLLVALLLLRRWRWVAGWMAFWGFATALSRMTTMGSGSWHQTAVRVANGGVPLAIFLAWRPLFRPNS